MVSPDSAPSLGRRFVLVVMLGAILPLGAVALWTTQNAAGSGRALLRSQLESQLGQTVRDATQRWEQLRSQLMTLGENEPVRQALLDSTATGHPVPPFVLRVFAQMTGLNRVVLRDRGGRERWALGNSPLPSNGGGSQPGAEERGMMVRVPITDLVSGDTVGVIEASILVETIVPAATRLAAAEGPLTAVFADRAMVPSGADERLFGDERVEWGGHRWLTVRQRLSDLDLEIAMAGAVDPYTGLFGQAASRAAAAVLLVSVAIAVLIAMWTRRLTRDVERELAQREALAAVGEFASEMAHEVRNPLTAMRLDLQRVEEEAGAPDTVRGIVPRVLHQIDRMDRAVTGALRVARGGSVEPRPVDLREVLQSARRSAEPELSRRGARVIMDIASGQALELDGDSGALEQLFLNLFINAAQALGANGEVRVAAMRRNGSIDILISDNGSGMTPAQLARVQQPFSSSRREGTGLGLKIARRIVASHRGSMEIRSAPGEGTTVHVTLPAR
jgi:signal transduction histidine kinase